MGTRGVRPRKMSRGARAVRAIHPDAHVQTPGEHRNGGSIMSARLEAPMTTLSGTRRRPLPAAAGRSSSPDRRVARAARIGTALIVKEDDDGGVCRPQARARAGEDRAICRSVTAHELVEQLRALDRGKNVEARRAPDEEFATALATKCLAGQAGPYKKDSPWAGAGRLTVNSG